MGLKIERAEFVNKTFRFNIKLMREVEALCQQKGISMNRFVDLALRSDKNNSLTGDDIRILPPKKSTHGTAGWFESMV